MSSSLYPNGSKVWTDRRNRIDDVDANDVNSAYAEITAIENALGPNPFLIQSGPTGQRKNYQTVAKRLDAITIGDLTPVWRLNFGDYSYKTNQEYYVGYNKINDPYGFYNTSDITIQGDGYYHVMVANWWDFNANGYRWNSLEVNGHEVANDTRPGSTAGSQRSVYLNISWEGLLHKGDRLRTKVYQTSGRTLSAGAFQFLGHYVRSYDPTAFNT